MCGRCRRLTGGRLPGYPESPGCVHLPYGFSRLFAITWLGATVVIDGDAASHVRSSALSLLAPFDNKGRPVERQLLNGQQFAWNPDRSPGGPTTIIVSKSDAQVVVMRGGVEMVALLQR